MSGWVRAFYSNPTPRHLAVAAGALGAFGFVGYATLFFSGFPEIPRLTMAWLIFTSILMIAAGATLWRPSRVGWWLAWCTMWAIAASGVLPFGIQAYLHFQPSIFFRTGFMSIGAGTFFWVLSHPAIHTACFARRPRPHPVLLNAPAIVILVGVILLIFDPEPGFFSRAFGVMVP